MKATSIEQIREHLAKGGRALAVLKDGRTDEVKRVDMGMLRVYAGIWSSSFACVDVDHWQLLPLEEKEPETVASDKIEAAGRLVKFIREHSSGQCRILSIGSACECPLCDVGRLLEEKEPVDHGTQKGQAKDGRDPMPCELNREAYLDLLREDFDWLVEQPRSLEREHIKEVLSWLMKNRPDGTQKGQEEKPKRGAWLEFADDGKLVTDVMHEPKDAVMPDSFVWCEEAGIHETEWRQRIRTRLLHGQWPEMQDLMDWWEATTGERIEWGRRCVICDGQGRLKSNSGDKRPGYEYTGCPGCSNGYSVRPTWMNQ